MKRFISWIVMFFVYIVVYWWEFIAFIIVRYIFGLIDKLPTILTLLCYLIGGTTLLGILLAPIIYGPNIAISASESIKPSKKGNRYKIFSIIMLLLASSNFLLSIFSNEINLASLFVCAFSIVLLITTNITGNFKS